MLEGKRIGVVVPAYDEEARILATIRSIPVFVDVVVVVDDASRDETSEIVRSAPSAPGEAGRLHLVRHSVNRGAGAAIVSGYRRALELDVEVCVVMAGDGQMDPRDLPKLLAPVLAGRADYAKGDRFSHPDIHRAMPLQRYLAGRALSVATARASGLSALSDSQSGFTAISRTALSAIDLDALWPGYGYPNDLIGLVARAGLRIADVPVRPVYRGERSGVRAWHLATISLLIARVFARRLRAPW